MAVVWQCKCGVAYEETGNASAWGRLRVHLRDRGPQCGWVGLVDTETGEIVAGGVGVSPWAALRQAEEQGYVDPHRPRVRPGERRAKVEQPPAELPDLLAESEATSQAPAATDASKPPMDEQTISRMLNQVPVAADRPKPGAEPPRRPGGASPQNLEAIIPYQRIALHPRVLMQKAMCDDFLVREDGTPYGWDSADVAEWVNGMVDLGFAFVMRQHLMSNGHAPQEVARLLRDGFLAKLIATAKSVPAEELRGMLLEHGVPEATISAWSGGDADAEGG